MKARLYDRNLDEFDLRNSRNIDWAGGQIAVVTDFCVAEPIPGPKVAWLLEPPANRMDHYNHVLCNLDDFEAVFTHVLDLVPKDRRIHYCPHGSMWVEPAEPDKAKIVSCIASSKKWLPGHILRHGAIERYRVDAYGEWYELLLPREGKAEALAPYMYSIVTESIRQNGYYTEKLLDCLALGTVPIYYGAPTTPFDEGGIIRFETLDELGDVLERIGAEDYARRSGAIARNREKAEEYASFSDNVYHAGLKDWAITWPRV